MRVPVIMARYVLGFRMEEPASRHGGYLRLYRTDDNGWSSSLGFGERPTNPHRTENSSLRHVTCKLLWTVHNKRRGISWL